MVQALRRTVDEWFTIFDLSPNIRHVFVEGGRDVDLIRQLIPKSAPADVRSINEVAIRTTMAPTPYLGGNRLRIYELGVRISRTKTDNASVLIDADLGQFDTTDDFPACLIRTDFSSLPVCFLSWEDLCQGLQRALGYITTNHDRDLIDRAMKFLFSFRRYRYKYHPSCKPPSASTLVHCEQRSTVLKIERFLERFALMGCPCIPGEALDIILCYEQDLDECDHRVYYHFHDFIAFLFEHLRCERRLPSSFRIDHLEAVILASMRPGPGCQQIDALVEWLRCGPDA